MSRLVIYILISFFVIGIFSCKKYPEDDVFIQWKRPDKRLIKYGPWVFDKLTVDGIDKSAEFRSDSAYFDRMEFIVPDSDVPNLWIFHNNILNEKARFKLLENDKFLRLDIIPTLPNEQNYTDYGPIFIDTPTEWTILKLSKNGLIIAVLYNGQLYKMELIPM